MTKPKTPTTFPTIYHDGIHLYLEWPTIVLKFTFTDAGLHKALKHIPNIASHPGYMARAVVANKVLPKIARITKQKQEIQDFSPEQRQAADAVLRKIGGGNQ